MTERIALGARGENVAADYLRNKGYAIIEMNCRNRMGEIDIIARDGKTIVIVEVKTRSSDFSGEPLEAITPKKAQKLRRLADAWMADHAECDAADIRIDCIGILLSGETERIEHVEDAV